MGVVKMAVELAYSLHLSSDKNKKPSSRKIAKDNPSGTTSQSKNSIQTAHDLSKADKHNLRKYDNDRDKIFILVGSDSLYKDVQDLYLREFDEARVEYNNKLIKDGHKERIVENYFDKIANDHSHDLACEVIIELGDKDFWQDKDDEYKKKMSDVYNEQVKDLERLIPAFKVANAVVHLDETSPHMHIMGVPVSENNERGLRKQVAKSRTFTRETLANIQDEMRKCCIKSYNKFYGTVTELKKKQKGRNQDIKVKDMPAYKSIVREQEKILTENEKTNEKSELLKTKTQEINQMLDNLKPTTFNKNNKIITNDDVEKLKDYTKQVDEITNTVQKSGKIRTVINNIEKKYNQLISENDSLKLRLNTAESKIAELKEDISWKDRLIDQLRAEKQKFEELYYKFRSFWHDIIKRFQGMIGFYHDESYKKVAKDLYEHDVFDLHEYETVLDVSRKIKTTEELQKTTKNRNDKVK